MNPTLQEIIMDIGMFVLTALLTNLAYKLNKFNPDEIEKRYNEMKAGYKSLEEKFDRHQEKDDNSFDEVSKIVYEMRGEVTSHNDKLVKAIDKLSEETKAYRQRDGDTLR